MIPLALVSAAPKTRAFGKLFEDGLGNRDHVGVNGAVLRVATLGR